MKRVMTTKGISEEVTCPQSCASKHISGRDKRKENICKKREHEQQE